MAKNIYDLFNERKYGVDYLVEGYEDFDLDVPEYENLDVAIESLNEIIEESTNETIELQAAFYLENLVLENMMYTDFDEETIQAAMEGAVRDKFETAKAKVKHWWEKLKAWFKGTYTAIINHFKSGETLVRQNGKKIDDAIKSSHLKVKMNKYKNLDNAQNQVFTSIDAIKMVGKNLDAEKDAARETVLKFVSRDCTDKKDVAKEVRKIFIEEENVEQEIRNMPVDVVKHYAGSSKKVIDNIKKQEKRIDEDFRNILKDLQEAERKASADQSESAERKLANFNFALSVKNIMLSTQMAVIKKASSDYTTVIRRALNAPANKKADKKYNKEKALESINVEFDYDEPEFY